MGEETGQLQIQKSSGTHDGFHISVFRRGHQAEMGWLGKQHSTLSGLWDQQKN
jgi:hypothetical protein